MTEKEVQKVLDELNTVRIEVLNDEAKRLFEAIMKIAGKRDELQKTVERKDLEISSLKQVHDYDVQMIDDVKGKAVELYDRIEEKDKIIDLMAERVVLTEEEWKEIKEKNIYNIIQKDTHKLIKQYFENKAKEVRYGKYISKIKSNFEWFI